MDNELNRECHIAFGYAVKEYFNSDIPNKKLNGIEVRTYIESMMIHKLSVSIDIHELKIIINLTRPGLLIGPKGKLINFIQDYLQETLPYQIVDGLKVQIHIEEEKDLHNMYVFCLSEYEHDDEEYY